MYIPAAFSIEDRERLLDYIASNGFGVVVMPQSGRLVGSHLPMVVERCHDGPSLLGHFARQNDQWKEADGQEALAIFSGPHAYVSPTWYGEVKVVPTWNYIAVHVYGTLSLLQSGAETIDMLERMTVAFEGDAAAAWSFQPGDEYFRRMAGQVVGFRIVIARIEGKWKLSQNHPIERRRRVIDGLRARGDADALAIAALMEECIEETER